MALRTCTIATLLVSVSPFVLVGADSKSKFDRDIAPLLAKRCLGCHSGAEPKGGLDLSRRDSAVKGGDSGRAIVAGQLDKSLLWKRVAAGEMPPKKPLSSSERRMLKSWIAGGAKWGTSPIDPFRYTSDSRAGYDWWSLQPVHRRPIPRAVWGRNPIDAFIHRGLVRNGLTPSNEADRRTLVRRLTFDLTGLPPAPEAVEAFEQDSSPDAYERLVDRLLASPQYGERWGRHWLDIARFGESQGFERDKLRTNSWRFRDWVIGAFNDDMPYNRFAKWQLAGDVLRPGDARAIVATGFLVAGPYDEVGQNQQSKAMKAVVRQDELEDYVSVTGQTFLGLTIHCARCHDHKFDPIRQVEYYRLTATLAGVRHGTRNIASLPIRQEAKERQAALQSRIQMLQDRIASAQAGDASDENIAHWKFEIDQLQSRLKRWAETSTYAVTPRPPEKAYFLVRGNPAQKDREVKPGGVAALSGVPGDFHLTSDASDANRRMKLAEWITDRGNPLFARVIVNRLWHCHFGRGLVNTPSDFGFNGGRPSHKELLDWLASELIRHGFRLKPIQRLIVSSATYRQSSRYSKGAAAIDAGNRFLWRMSPRRLEAEAVRDTMLAVAGRLNGAMGGPGFQDFTTFVRNTQFYEMRDPVGHSFNRRSVYRTWVRSGRSRFLDAFDCPDPSTKTPKRAVTITPLQALSLLNNSFVLRMSDRFASRLKHECGEDAGKQVQRAWQLVFGRHPDTDEQKQAVAFASKHGLPALCRVLFNANEFLVVD